MKYVLHASEIARSVNYKVYLHDTQAEANSFHHDEYPQAEFQAPNKTLSDKKLWWNKKTSLTAQP